MEIVVILALFGISWVAIVSFMYAQFDMAFGVVAFIATIILLIVPAALYALFMWFFGKIDE